VAAGFLDFEQILWLSEKAPKPLPSFSVHDIFVGFHSRRVGRCCSWGFATTRLAPAGEFCAPVHRHLPVDPGPTIFKYWIFRYLKPGVALFGGPPCAT